jgi:hypothetical protein
MDVNDYAGCLMPRGALGFFASMLAPTGGGVMPQMTEYPAMRDNAGKFQE